MKSENFQKVPNPGDELEIFFLSRWSCSDECLFFCDIIFSTVFYRVSYTCSSDYSVYDGRCTYTHLLHAHFFAHRACTVTVAHLHACPTHASQGCQERFFAHVSFLSISPSPFSCLTHLLLSPCDSLSLSTFPSTRSCRTYLSSKRRACASPHEDEKFGYLAKSALNSRFARHYRNEPPPQIPLTCPSQHKMWRTMCLSASQRASMTGLSQA